MILWTFSYCRAQLSKDVDRFLPQLNEMKEVERRRRELRPAEALGATQASELRQRSNEEYVVACQF